MIILNSLWFWPWGLGLSDAWFFSCAAAWTRANRPKCPLCRCWNTHTAAATARTVCVAMHTPSEGRMYVFLFHPACASILLVKRVYWQQTRPVPDGCVNLTDRHWFSGQASDSSTVCAAHAAVTDAVSVAYVYFRSSCVCVWGGSDVCV